MEKLGGGYKSVVGGWGGGWFLLMIKKLTGWELCWTADPYVYLYLCSNMLRWWFRWWLHSCALVWVGSRSLSLKRILVGIEVNVRLPAGWLWLVGRKHSMLIRFVMPCGFSVKVRAKLLPYKNLSVKFPLCGATATHHVMPQFDFPARRSDYVM